MSLISSSETPDSRWNSSAPKSREKRLPASVRTIKPTSTMTTTASATAMTSNKISKPLMTFPFLRFLFRPRYSTYKTTARKWQTLPPSTST